MDRSILDRVSDDELERLIIEYFQPGTVFLLFVQFTVPAPKEKFLVLITAEREPLFFLINSEIHEFIKKQPALLECQVKILSQDYDFLEHDSYINCAQPRRNLTLEEIIQQLKNKRSRIKGVLSADDRQRIVEAVQKAKTIDNHTKKIIVQAMCYK